MRKRIYLKYFCLILSFCFYILGAQQTNSYFENHTKLAKKLSKKYGIPSSVILSIAFVEAGGGNSLHAKKFNNHFGITGVNTVSKSRYRNFNSTEECFEEFCKIISRKKYYSKLKDSDNVDKWIQSIASGGYSTKPKIWSKKVKNIIVRYHLSE